MGYIFHTKDTCKDVKQNSVVVEMCLSSKKSYSSFSLMYQINTGQADGTPGLDLNVAEAWELGYTGKGVTIGIMDDGK